MKQLKLSLTVFGSYFATLGIVLMVYPELLSFFAIDVTSPWIRVVGLSVLVLGVFYFLGGIQGNRLFAQVSLFTRSFQLVFFAIIVFLEMLPPIVMLFAGIEFLSGVWTFFALRASDASQ